MLAQIAQLGEMRAEVLVEGVVAHLGEARDGAWRGQDGKERFGPQARLLDVSPVAIGERRSMISPSERALSHQ